MKEIKNFTFKYGNPSLKLFSVGTVLSILSSILSLFVTYTFKNVINSLIYNNFTTSNFLKIILLLLVSLLIGFFSDYILGIFGFDIVRNFRSNIWEHIVYLPQYFFDRNNSGNIASHIVNDTSKISDLLSQSIPSAITGVIMVVSSVVMMFKLSYKITLLICIIVPLIFIVIIPLIYFLSHISRITQNELAKLTGIITDLSNNEIIIKSFGAEEKSKNLEKKSVDNLFKLNKKQVGIMSIINPIISLLLMVIMFAAMVYGGILIGKKELTFGALMSFMMFLMQINAPIMSVITMLNDIGQSVGAVNELIKYTSTLKEPLNSGTNIGFSIKSVQFKNVSFKYPESVNYVLKNINLNVKAGEKLVIIGKSGVGKSTLVKCFLRLYDNYEGEILINGIDIKKYSIKSLRKRITFVSQNNIFYSGTLLDNLLISDSNNNFNEKDINKWLNYFDLKKDVHLKINSNLSGGEEQRLSIIRALLKKADVVIFDEATANLDNENKIKVKNIIDQLSTTKIVIFITHDLSLTDNEKNILDLNGGKING